MRASGAADVALVVPGCLITSEGLEGLPGARQERFDRRQRIGAFNWWRGSGVVRRGVERVPGGAEVRRVCRGTRWRALSDLRYRPTCGRIQISVAVLRPMIERARHHNLDRRPCRKGKA